MKDIIQVTRSSMPTLQEYVKEIEGGKCRTVVFKNEIIFQQAGLL